MPGQTTSLKLPYPLVGDPANVPADIKALAEKTDDNSKICLLKRDTSQAIPTGIATILNFPVEVYDPHSMYSGSAGTDPDRITLPFPGIWQITASAIWAANSTGARQILVQSESAAFADIETVAFESKSGLTVGGNLVTHNLIGYRHSIEVGEHVYASVFQASGGSLNVTGAEFNVVCLRNLS